MTQPIGGGEIKTYTWSQTLGEARRMAAYLRSLDLSPGSHIAILSKNCAHLLISDLAIWMAGYVSVALYPTLNAETVNYILTQSDSKLLFLGKLDTWDEMKPGVPEGLPCVAYPSSLPNEYPAWDDLVAKTEPLEGQPTRSRDETAILIYTSGSTGQPKGVMLTFGNLGVSGYGVHSVFNFGPDDRQLSYLPLAHALERALVGVGSFHNGNQVFFVESLSTFAADLRRARPTIFHSVPRLWLKFQLGVFAKLPPKRLALLLKLPIVSSIIKKKVLGGLGLDAARYAFTGSAPIPPRPRAMVPRSRARTPRGLCDVRELCLFPYLDARSHKSGLRRPHHARCRV